MTFKMIEKPPHGTIPWLNNRWKWEGRCVFGASDVPALLGVSPWRTRGELFFDKLTPPVLKEETAAMRRGNILEAPILGEAGRVLGREFITPEFQYLKGRLMVSLDGLPADEVENPSMIVEVKTTTAHTIESSDDLPQDWCAQGWAQSEVLGGVPVVFAVLDRRQNIVVVELKDNPAARQFILQETERFGELVDLGEVQGEFIDELDADQIATYFKATDKEVLLDDETMRWVIELENARRIKTDAEKAEKAAKDALAKVMLDATVGMYEGEPVISWKETAGREAFDAKAFEKAHPDLAQQFTKITASYRTMRLINKKGK